MSQRVIGLTGGIGTGKTTVANYLAETYKITVLDADIYARDAVAPNSPILQDIFTRYGDRLRLSDGSLNRAALGEIIFNNETEKQWLESKIHPYVRDRFEKQLQIIEANTVVLAIPLLFEANMTDLVTEIWVVRCSDEKQLARIQKRDRISEEQAKIRIASQLPLAEKVKMADVVLNNDSTKENLYEQVKKNF